MKIANKITGATLLLAAVNTYAVTMTQAQVVNVGPTSTSANNVAWPNPRFVPDSTGDCEIDQMTGLMWVQNLDMVNNGAVATWSSAKSIASFGAWCGHNDWRLPNVTELKSLVDYQDTSSPRAYLNTYGFLNVQTGNYWSSTAYAPSTGYAWIVGMVNGSVFPASGVGFNFYVWPVRGGQ